MPGIEEVSLRVDAKVNSVLLFCAVRVLLIGSCVVGEVLLDSLSLHDDLENVTER